MTPELTKALNKTKIDLMAVKNSTFITSILWSLKQSFSESVPTAGTDGLNLMINPTWFMELTHPQRIGLLAHEAWHVALEHMVRGKGFNHRIYNVAADYVINLMLQDAGYELPPHGYVDEKFRDMTTEQVYNAIYEQETQNPSNYPTDVQFPSGGGSGEDDDNPSSGSNPDDIQQKIESIIIKAHMQAEMTNNAKEVGSIPADILRRIEELRNPKLPWNVILQNFVNAFAKVDYSYARPKKKFIPDFYLPSLSGATINHIAIAIDSSGSVTDEEFTSFLREIDNIKDFCQPNKLSIIDFDSSIKAVHSLTPDDDLWRLQFKGYGGTNLKPPFKEAKKLNPDLFIVFSDLECRKIKEEPSFPVIWVVVNNPHASVDFGQRIDMETE